MGSHLKYPFTRSIFFLLSCTATIVACSARPQSSYKQTSQHSPSYLQPHDFPNEQLYHAYFVIQRFKNTITCDPRNITRTWTGQDICGKKSYLGFYCASSSGYGENLTITSVGFSGLGLCAPKLQGFIDQLPDLALIQATSNNFSGDIPSLDGLSNMYNLDGKHCILIQVEKTKIVKIDCEMEYALQKRVITSATNAKGLLLSNNNLSGPLPTNIGFSQLSYLALANNKLTGPIPPTIAQAQDTLLEVLLLNNQLSGCLPHELGLLNRAAVIDAGMNQLTGPIPSSLSCLSSIEQLNLAGNRLYGEIPDALCKLAGPAGRLANLTLSSNYFTSVGPACSALIKDGVLNVKNNCIPGFANQRQPAECAAFLSQPRTCPAASTHVACPAADVNNVVAPEGRVARDYSSYVTYATLHE